MRKNYLSLIILLGSLLAACTSGSTSPSEQRLTIAFNMESQIFTENSQQPANPYQTPLTITLLGSDARYNPNRIYPVTFQSSNGSLSCESVTAMYNTPVNTTCTEIDGIVGNATLNALIAKQVIGSFNFLTGNNLFDQPENNNDNSCGIRQLLLAQHVLTKNDGLYIGNILPVWQSANFYMNQEYPYISPGQYTLSLPSIYTYAAVAAVQGGPRNLVSNTIIEAQTNLGMQAVTAYVWESQAINIFGDEIYQAEVDNITALNVPISYINGPMTQSQFESGYYYMIVIHNGNHWIGTTTETTFNSLTTGPVPYDAFEVESDGFSGVAVKYTLKP